MKAGKKGFTLVELLVVISVIAVLLAILIPSLRRAKMIAQRVICGNQLKQVGAGMIMYADAHDNMLPADYIIEADGTKLTDEHPYVLYRGDKGYAATLNPETGRYAPLRLAYLFEKKIIQDPKVFYCPGNVAALYRYESYCNPVPWGTLPQECNYLWPRGFKKSGDENQWIRSGYGYCPIDPTIPLNVTTGYPDVLASRFDRLDRTMPYMSDTINSREGLSHKSGIKKYGKQTVVVNPGINVLYKDGHVVFCSDRRVFSNDVWDQWDVDPDIGERLLSLKEYIKFYYTVYKLASGTPIIE